MKTIILEATFLYALSQGKDAAKEFNERMELEKKPFMQKKTESGVLYLIREEEI